MKITLEDLAPYLPYGLKIAVHDSLIKEFEQSPSVMEAVDKYDSWGIERVVTGKTLQGSELKPILRPLSEFEEFEDILDEFSINSLSQFKECFFGAFCDINLGKFDNVGYTVMTLMFKHHIDIFGLIEKGLAISYNDIK